MSLYGRSSNATRWRTYQPVPPGRKDNIDSRRPIQGMRGMHVAQGTVSDANRFNAENRTAKRVTYESHQESDLVQVEYRHDSLHRGASDYNRNTRLAQRGYVQPQQSAGHQRNRLTRGHYNTKDLADNDRWAETRGIQTGHDGYYGVDSDAYRLQRDTVGRQAGYQRDDINMYGGQRREVTQDMINEFTRNTKYSPEEENAIIRELPYNRNGYNRNTKTVRIDPYGYDEDKLPYTDTSGFQISAPYAVDETSRRYKTASGNQSPFENAIESRGTVTSSRGGLPRRPAATGYGEGPQSRTLNSRCTICKEYARDARFLNCQHSFCRHCLDLLLQRRMVIVCPICRETTQFEKGTRVDDLPGQFDTFSELDKLVVVEVKGVISDVTIAHDVLVAGCNNKLAPIYIFDFQGNTLAQIGRDIVGPSPKLTYNSKRNLLIANVKNKIASFEKTGSLVAQLANPAFQYACGVVYHMPKDWYIIPDEKTNALQCYNPQSARVVRTIGLRRDEPSPFSFPACIACDNHGGSGLVAISDRKNHLIKVIDLDGQYAQTFGYRGKGYGQLEHPLGVCFDYVGRLLICDSGNKRVVRLTPDAVEGQEQWECLLSQGILGNALPKCVDVSPEGILIVSTYQKAIAAPDNIHIFEGYE